MPDLWLSQLKLATEIGLVDVQRFFLSPFFQAHLLDQAKIVNLGVVRGLGGAIRNGVQVIAGEIGTLMAELKALFFDASINSARLVLW